MSILRRGRNANKMFQTFHPLGASPARPTLRHHPQYAERSCRLLYQKTSAPNTTHVHYPFEKMTRFALLEENTRVVRARSPRFTERNGSFTLIACNEISQMALLPPLASTQATSSSSRSSLTRTDGLSWRGKTGRKPLQVMSRWLINPISLLCLTCTQSSSNMLYERSYVPLNALREIKMTATC